MRPLFALAILLLGAHVPLVAANAAPTLATGGAPAPSVTEHQTVAVFPQATVADADDTQLKRLEVTILGAQPGDTLAYTLPPGIVASGSSSARVFDGDALLATYQTLLRSITFRPNGDAPGASRQISAQVTDAGNAASATLSVTVTITQQNDAPAFSPAGPIAVNATEQGAATLWGSVDIVDPDSTTMNRLEIAITAPLAGDDLGFANQAGITVTDSTTSLLATGVASRAAYEALLNSVTFTAGADVPGATRTVTVTVRDSTDVTSVALAANVTITAVNDAPTITGTPATAATSEGVAVSAFPGAVVADVDSAQLDRLEVLIDNEQGTDLLEFTPVPGITVVRETDGDLIATGAAAPASYQTLLRSVTFRPDGDAPGTSRTLRARIRDNASAFSAETQVTVAITLLNDAPVVPSTPLEFATNEEQARTLAWSDVTAGMTDPDGGTAPNARIASVEAGTLELLNGATATPAVAGTILAPGQQLRWSPATDAVDEAGSPAFTIVAWDGLLASATTRTVRMKVQHIADIAQFDDPVIYYLNSGRMRLATAGDQMAFQADDRSVVAANGSRLVAVIASAPPGAIDQDGLFVISNTSAAITIASGARILRAGTEVATWSWSAGSRTLTITFNGAASVDDVEKVSRCIAYDNAFGDTGTVGARTITLRFEESGRPASNTRSKTLTVAVPNSPPSIILGTEAVPPTAFDVPVNGIATLLPSDVRAEDDAAVATSLVYTVISAPAYGDLRLTIGGLTSVLGQNSSFTQADIDAGRISYRHRGGTIPSDTIGLQVADAPTGGLLSNPKSLIVQIGGARGLAIISDPLLVAQLGTTVVHGIRLAGGSGETVPTVQVRWLGDTSALGTIAGSQTLFVWQYTFDQPGLKTVEVVVLDASGNVLVTQPMQVKVVADLVVGG